MAAKDRLAQAAKRATRLALGTADGTDFWSNMKSSKTEKLSSTQFQAIAKKLGDEFYQSDWRVRRDALVKDGVCEHHAC